MEYGSTVGDGEMKKHRVILIGHGGISQSYLRAFSSNDDVVIVGVVGRNMVKAGEFADKHGIPFFGTNVEEVARQSTATAAVICTPNAVHYEGVIAASLVGLHCLCEKPLDITREKQRSMIESCRTHSVKLAVSYLRRFSSHLQFIKGVIESGGLGRITAIDVTLKHFRSTEYYNSWHGTKEVDGGGPFIQQASHIIDLALWLSGGYREIITAKRFQIYHDIETEDHGYAIVQYNNGAIGMIQASTACKGLNQEVIEISGTEGSITTNFNEIITFQIPGLQQPVFESSEGDNIILFERLARDFIQSIDENRFPFVDGESAAMTTEFICDIYDIAGEPVRTYT
jgi:UDP-N-acetyl-2-amino-2-deoxyglucuronate dehydrogenase